MLQILFAPSLIWGKRFFIVGMTSSGDDVALCCAYVCEASSLVLRQQESLFHPSIEREQHRAMGLKQSEAFLCVWETEISTLRYFWTEGSSLNKKERKKNKTTTWLIQSFDQFYYGSFYRLFARFAKQQKIRIYRSNFQTLFGFYYCLIKAQLKRAKVFFPRRSSTWISFTNEAVVVAAARLESEAKASRHFTQSALNNFNHVWLLPFYFYISFPCYNIAQKTSHLAPTAENFSVTFLVSQANKQSLSALCNLQSFSMQHWRSLSLIH